MIEHFRIIRRWFWLLALATIVAAATTYWVSKQELTLYDAKTRLIIGPGIDSPNPDLNALRAGGKLILTYAELATMRPTIQAALDDLKLDLNPTIVNEMIETKSDETTQTLSITVRDEDREQAIAIANAIANVLVRLSPSNPDSPEAKFEEQRRNQATRLEASIAASEILIQKLEDQLKTTTNLQKQALIRDQLSKERNHFIEGTRTVALLHDSLQNASINQVRIVEPAIRATFVNTRPSLRVWIGAISGLILGLVIALTFEYLDDTIKTVEGLTQATNIPLLGAIAGHKVLQGVGRESLVVQALPKSLAAENYRMLGTKLLSKCLALQASNTSPIAPKVGQKLKSLPPGVNPPVGSIMISSIQTEHDTGELAANLATILAQIGQRVILIDAQLHHPTIGQLFGMVETNGLTNFLTEQFKVPALIPVEWAPGLSILPAGPVPPDPFELLASPRMANLIEELKSQADIVIITTSPLLPFADGLILASRVDGVVVVACNGKTSRNKISSAVESLRSLNAYIIGAVFDYNNPWRLPLLATQMVKQASMKTLKRNEHALAN